MKRLVAVLRAVAVGALTIASGTLVGCGSRSFEWNDEDGYRWRELAVSRRGGPGFTELEPSRTGIEFSNQVTDAQLMRNRHLGQGSGVTLGDVDADGLVDIYFGRIEGPNVLYRNLGDWRFEDITEASRVAAADRHTTGVAFADVDGDRDLDLVVAAMGGPNSLFVNDGNGVFSETSQEAGLDSQYGSTTVTLADVDDDGDLDLYIANYRLLRIEDVYPPQDRTFERTLRRTPDGGWEVVSMFEQYYRVRYRSDLDAVVRTQRAEPDLFYLNDGSGKFQRVPLMSGRFVDEDGKILVEEPEYFNLTARFYDMDDDGDQDLFVCADFEDPDQIWINNGDGTFQAIPRLSLRTTSNSAMAVDFADIDRDGDVDFFESDMLARDPRRRKMQKPSHTPFPKLVGEIANRPQMMRNTLFVNRGDHTYGQIAEFADVEAAGWSWSTVFLDVDLNGFEDILLLTGHTWDVMDFDTQNRIFNDLTGGDWRRERFLFPSLELPNVIFRNNGDLTFDEVGHEWGVADQDDISHGPALGDLDGDGDLDFINNRLYLSAGVYRNDATAGRVAIRLIGDAPNTAAVGSKITVLDGAVRQQRQEVTVGGLYLSSSDQLYSFATGEADQVSIVVEWKSGKRSVLERVAVNRSYEIHESAAVDRMNDEVVAVDRTPTPLFTDVSADLSHVHSDSMFDDMRRQPLLQNTMSLLGPGISWYDVDRDGDEDLLVSSGRGGDLSYYRNDSGTLRQLDIMADLVHHDQTTVVAIPNQTGGTALLVGQSNYEVSDPNDALRMSPVLRMEFGPSEPGGSTTTPRGEPSIAGDNSAVGPLALADYDNDGDLDLFVGGRVIPSAYPIPATSRLYHNAGGHFESDETNQPLLFSLGLVSAASFSDLDADGDQDLLIALEWGPIKVFRNDGGIFSDDGTSHGFAQRTSRWHGLATGDLNEDGLPDIVATSWGRNTRYDVSSDRPLQLYYADFDRNGSLDLIEAQYDGEREGLFPLDPFPRIRNAMPRILQRIPNHMAFADATVEELLGEQLAQAEVLQVNTFEHTLFLSQGGSYQAVPLPAEAQFAPSFYAGISDFDGDGHEDLFLTQNFFPTEIETPRLDAGRGLLLLGDGAGQLTPVEGTASGIMVYGDQRGAAFADYDADGRTDLVVSQNGAETKLYRNVGAVPGVRVRLVGSQGNPHAIGAAVRLVYADGRGPVREIQAGSGYWSHNGAIQVLGIGGDLTGVWVRWPDGTEMTEPITGQVAELVIRYAELAPTIQ